MRFIGLYDTSDNAKASAERLDATPECYVCGRKIQPDEEWMMVLELDGGERWCEECAKDVKQGWISGQPEEPF